MRDKRECAHRFERLPDRRYGGRTSAREREGREKHWKRRQDPAKQAAARMVGIGERAFCSCVMTWQNP